MRIKLKIGYQNQLITEAKSKGNLTWGELAKKLRLNETYLKNEIRNEYRTISKKNYIILCKICGESFNRFIDKKLDDKWGQAKGGSNVKAPQLLIKNESKELAELTGVILGDGNIWTRKGGYYYLTICGNSQKDKDYLLNYIKPLCQKLFGKEMRIKYHGKRKEIFINIGSKDVIYTLEKYGLKSGDKIVNNRGIPDWIFLSNEYIINCIRGLIDTDGCVCPITGRDYPYIWFTSKIPKLRNDFDRAMKELDIKTSQWSLKKGQIFIGSKKMIKRYIQVVGFKNQRNLSKISPLSSEAKNAALSRP